MERGVCLHFLCRKQRSSPAIAHEVRARGFEAEVCEPSPEYPDSWEVVCETNAVLTPDFVRDSVDFFEGLAERHNAEYDGWEAAV